MPLGGRPKQIIELMHLNDSRRSIVALGSRNSEEQCLVRAKVKVSSYAVAWRRLMPARLDSLGNQFSTEDYRPKSYPLDIDSRSFPLFNIVFRWYTIVEQI
jgi:hypothetical protein